MVRRFLCLFLFVWSINPFAVAIPLQGKPGEIIFGGVLSEDIIISPQGNYFTSWAGYGLHTWNLHTGELVLSLPIDNLDGAVTFPRYGRCAFSPDETRFIHALGNTAEIYDLRSGRLLVSLERPAGTINQVVFSPDGQEAAGLIEYQSQMVVWNAETGKIIKIYNAAYFTANPEDRVLFYNLYYPRVTVDLRKSDGSVTIQDMDVLSGQTFWNPANYYYDRTQDWRYVLRDASYKENTISIEDLNEKKSVFQFSYGIHDPQGYPGIREAFFLSDETRFFVTFGLDDIFIFRVSDHSLFKKITGLFSFTSSKADHPDRILVASLDPKVVRLYDYVKGETIRDYHQGLLSDVVSRVSLSPEGKYLLTSTKDYRVTLWDVHTGKPVRVLESTHSGYFLSEETYLTLDDSDGSLHIWSVTGTLLDSLQVPVSTLPGIVSVGNQVLAYLDFNSYYSGVSHGFVSVYNLNPLQFLGQYHIDDCKSLAVSREGFHVVCITEEGQSYKIDPLRKEVHPGPMLRKPILNDYEHLGLQSFQITRDGKEALLHAIWEENSRYFVEFNLWDLDTGEKKISYPYVYDLKNAFLSPDERYVMASGGKAFFVWDKQTGKVVQTFREIRSGFPFDLTRDYSKIAAGFGDKTVRIRKLEGLEIPTSGVSEFTEYR